MNKETQDRLWAALSKDERELMKSAYKSTPLFNVGYETGWSCAVRFIFGYHNLTSDEEPSEILLVEKKKVRQLYADYKNRITPTTGAVDKAAYGGVLLALRELFGDNRLPDKEPSAQVKPRSKVGAKVMKFLAKLHGQNQK